MRRAPPRMQAGKRRRQVAIDAYDKRQTGAAAQPGAKGAGGGGQNEQRDEPGEAAQPSRVPAASAACITPEIMSTLPADIKPSPPGFRPRKRRRPPRRKSRRRGEWCATDRGSLPP